MEPITTELRNAVSHVRGSLTSNTVKCVRLIEVEFDRLCDNIDAVHAQLERDYATACAERDELRESVHKLVTQRDERLADAERRANIATATIAITPRIDWSRMADELDAFAATVRGMAGDAE